MWFDESSMPKDLVSFRESRHKPLVGRYGSDLKSGLASPNHTANLSGLFLGCINDDVLQKNSKLLSIYFGVLLVFSNIFE